MEASFITTTLSKSNFLTVILKFGAGNVTSTNTQLFSRISGNTWLRNTPDGLFNVLKFVRQHYGEIPVIITENGCADVYPLTPNRDFLNDNNRVRYLRDHIRIIGQGRVKTSV